MEGQLEGQLEGHTNMGLTRGRFVRSDNGAPWCRHR